MWKTFFNTKGSPKKMVVEARIMAISFCAGSTAAWLTNGDRVIAGCAYFVTTVTLCALAMYFSPRHPMPDVLGMT
jgi:hypothetical protein